MLDISPVLPETGLMPTNDETAARQLRAWAIETALGKAALETKNCEDHHTITVDSVLTDAKAIVKWVVNG